jgi:hypothetical protein
MNAEHLFHWLTEFFKKNPKINWEKNELLEAIRDQYMELLGKKGAEVFREAKRMNEPEIP